MNNLDNFYVDDSLAGFLGWSPTDVIPYVVPPSYMKLAPLRMHDVAQFSLSTHRERFMVSRLGVVEPVGFTHGPLTVAGSLTLQELDVLPFKMLRSKTQTAFNMNKLPRVDELPPIGLLFVFVNEYGDTAVMHVSDIEFLDEGYATGVDQTITYITYGWVGRDYYLTVGDNIKSDYLKYDTTEPISTPLFSPLISPSGTVNLSAEDMEASE